MQPKNNQLTVLAQKHGADGWGAADVSDIIFRREFRDACAQNACGKYGACWMCPPDVGDIDEMMAEAQAYRHAFVIQTIGRLEDSFDIEGMAEAAVRHNRIMQSMVDDVAKVLDRPLILGAGACHTCERCAKLDDTPCRFPGRAMPSLEAYGIAVSDLAASCGLKYINGQNTVTYFGGFFYG